MIKLSKIITSILSSLSFSLSCFALPVFATPAEWDIASCDRIGTHAASTYAVDYLKFLNSTRLDNPWSELVEVSSLQEADDNIFRLLQAKFPQLAWNYSEFNYFRDHAVINARRQWREVLSLAKIETKDLEILPDFCTGWAAQAIKRVVFGNSQDAAVSYEYDEYYLSLLSDPLQLSYVYTHEWLLDFFGDHQLENVRYVNDFLHSQSAWNLDPMQFQRLLTKTWGMNSSQMKVPITLTNEASTFAPEVSYNFGASGYRVGKGSDFISSPPR